MKAVYIVRCTKDESKNVIGTCCHNPVLKSMIYDIELLYGEIMDVKVGSDCHIIPSMNLLWVIRK